MNNSDRNQKRSTTVIVLDIPKASCADGTIDLVNQRIREVINSGDRLDDDDPRDLVDIIRWFNVETVTSLTDDK